MSKKICIVGAGPGGLTLARILAENGNIVTVFDSLSEDANITRHNWSDAVEYDVLEQAGLPVPEISGDCFTGAGVKNGLDTGGLYEPHRIPSLTVYAPEYDGRAAGGVDFRFVLLDRAALQRYLLQKAREAGADVRFSTPVTGLLGDLGGGLEEINVRGVVLSGSGGNAEYECDLTVDATGHQSKLRALMGEPALSRPYAPDDFGYAFRTVRRYEKSGVQPSIPFEDHYCYGKHRGYFWVHFHNDYAVDIGGGVPLEGAARGMVLDMVASLPDVTQQELRGGGGKVLVGTSPPVLTASGFLAVGDAAGQTNPCNGCGVAGAMRGALLAARVLSKLEDFSLESLWEYNHLWFTGIGAHYAALGAMRRAFQAFSHEEICFLMESGIMSGDVLTNILHGVYQPGTPGMALKVLRHAWNRRGVLSKLLASDSVSKSRFKLYERYPAQWDRAAFNEWLGKAGLM